MDEDAVLAETLELLATSLTAEGIAAWMKANNRYLGARPVDLLTSNQHERVLEAARAFIEGTYL